ncbi:MAG: protein transport protein Yip1 [Amphiamblys sp. WSBS2006]|nr:MAG: protein transport protein Yip1 [Amphiamblys sp. WSBS2006]
MNPQYGSHKNTMDDLFREAGIADPTETFLQKLTGHVSGDAPLSEELGISAQSITRKTLSVVNPFEKEPKTLVEDPDLVGPFFFYLLFALLLLVSGKVHFGYIYGTVLLGWSLVFFLLKALDAEDIDGTKTGSVLGYSGIPLLVPAAFSVVFSFANIYGFLLCWLCVVWCSLCSARNFSELFQNKDKKAVLLCPLFLFYSFFGIVVVF